MDSCPPQFDAADEPKASAEVIDFPTSKAATYLSALQEYASKHRPPGAGKSAAELGAMSGLSRLIALRQSALAAVAAYYATHPRCDPAPGVLVMAAAFSDNADGACSISIDRMAKFLSRDRRTIEAALARIQDDRLVISEAVPGRPNRLTPYVHETFGRSTDPLTVILDAWAPRAPAKPVGRPRKLDSEIPPSPRMPLLFPENTSLTEDAPPISRTEKHPPQPDETPPSPRMPPDTTLDTAEDRKTLLRRIDDDVADEDDRAEFHRLCNGWGHSTSDGVTREVADQRLERALGAYREVEPRVLRIAFVAAINEMSAAEARSPGPRAMLNYFHKVLRTKVDESVLAEANAHAQAFSDQVIQEKRLHNRLHGVEQSTPRFSRGNRRSSLSDLMNELPDDGGFN